MADYGIDINVNMGGSQGNFQSLIASINQLNANFQKVGDSATTAGNRSKQSFADSMNIIKKYGGSVQSAAANIDKYKAKINELNRLYSTGAISQTKYNSQINAAATAINRIETATRQYNSVLGQTATHTRSATLGINTLTTAFNKLGAVMGVSFGLYGVFRVLQNGVKAITEFELAQKKLRSILGETEEGMKGVSQGAIALGRASIFGAKGVTELQIILAKMGFVKEDIINMQRAIVNLATATQEDLESSAEVVANIIRSYRMSSTETARVVDVIGKAFNTSALSLSNFRESIKYVAPVAKQAGFSIEETAAALAILSNAGIKGSLAGTGLNNVLKAMMDSNSKLSKYLGGTVKGFEGFISVLQKAKDEGWDMEMIYGLITQRATAAFSIMKNGVGDIEAFTDELLKASGTIEEQQRVQMESLAYQSKLFVEQFKAAWIDADESTNMFMQTLKGFVTFGQILFITDKQKDGSVKNLEAIQAKAADLYDFIQENDLGDEMRRQVQESVNGFDEYINGLTNKSDFWFRKNQAEIDNRIEKANQIHAKLIDSQAEKSLAFFRLYLTQDESSQKAYDRFVENISGQMRWLDKASIQYQAYARAIELATEAINEMTGISPTGTEDSGKLEKLAEQLKLEKQIAIESVKLKYNGDEEKRRIAQTTYQWDKRIAEETIEDEAEKGKTLKLLGLKLANEFKDIKTKSSIDLLKIEQSIQETRIKGMYSGFEEEKKLLESKYEYGLQILEKETEGDNNRGQKLLEYQEKYILESQELERKHRIDLLTSQKELSEINLQIQYQDYEETVKLRELTLTKELEILNERDLGTEEHNREYEKIMAKFHLAVKNEEERFQDELTKLIYEGNVLRGQIEGNSFNNRRKEIDLWYDYELSKLDKTAKNYEKMLENIGLQRDLKIKALDGSKSIWEMLFPDIDSGALDAMQQTFDVVTDYLSQAVSSWTDMTDKIVNQLNRQIDETQSALEVEATLMSEGYANNVTLKKKEFEDLKKARETALNEQRKAQKAQVAIDTITQISSLITASAQIIKGFSAIPVVGTGLGIAAVTLMLAAFATAKAKALQSAGVNKFERGGWVDGKRHSDGGTIIEAEKGEYVINKRSAFKHKELIEAINGDNKYELNKIYLNNLKNQVLTASVSLDDSKYLKGIYEKLNEKGKAVEYINGYRIERVGNVTTKIRLN